LKSGFIIDAQSLLAFTLGLRIYRGRGWGRGVISFLSARY
jgi:hypothetical protein